MLYNLCKINEREGKTIRISLKEYYKTGILFILAGVALIIGVRVVGNNTYKNIQLPPIRSAAEITTDSPEQTINIPVLSFTEEEAESALSRLKEEHFIPMKARASYVAEHEVHTDHERAFYLAAAICRECGGENKRIMMLVASVIMNRVESPHFPDSVYGVLTQKYQYGMMWKYGISFPDWADEDVRARCYEAAYRVLSGERACPPNVVYQAEFIQGSGIYEEYPGFYFCYE